MTGQTIAVTGNKYYMPTEFPLTRAENAGNMVHGIVPMELFPNAVHAGDPRKPWGASSGFIDWANNNATHLIFTLANTIRLSRKDAAPPNHQFIRGIRETLERIEKPKLVVFGLGSQAPSRDLESLAASDDVVALMQYLGNRCELIGVRGEFTRQAFAHFAGVTNTFVTGCPSTFSRPKMLSRLYKNTRRREDKKLVYSGTSYRRPAEKDMLLRAIQEEIFLVEPQSRDNHQFHVDVLLDKRDPTVPPYLLPELESGRLTASQAAEYFRKFYRLFRSRAEWDHFNDEFAGFTYGTRFHVNMASILSGVPALWVTHDSRTEELAEFLHLPSIPLDQAHSMSPDELASYTDYSDFFEHIDSKFANFNYYLSQFGLSGPKLQL